MATRIELAQRLKEIEIELSEIRQRLPAHSVKPQIMMELFALEDEREELLARIKPLLQAPGENGDEDKKANNSINTSEDDAALD